MRKTWYSNDGICFAKQRKEKKHQIEHMNNNSNMSKMVTIKTDGSLLQFRSCMTVQSLYDESEECCAFRFFMYMHGAMN